jgi:hypothetical protein
MTADQAHCTRYVARGLLSSDGSAEGTKVVAELYWQAGRHQAGQAREGPTYLEEHSGLQDEGVAGVQCHQVHILQHNSVT